MTSSDRGSVSELSWYRHWGGKQPGKTAGRGGASVASMERSGPPVGSPQGAWAIASSFPSLAFFPSGFIQMFPNQPLKDRRQSPFRAHGFSPFPGSAGHHHLPGRAGCPPGAGRAHPGLEDHPAGQEQLRRQGSVSTALMLSSLWYLHWRGQSRVDSTCPEAAWEQIGCF